MNQLIIILLISTYHLSQCSIASNDINRYSYNCTGKDSECGKQKVNVDFELCASKVCIYKCCPKDEVVNGTECVPMKGHNFSNVAVYDYYLYKVNKKFNEIFHIVTNKFANREFAEAAYYAIYIGGNVYLEEVNIAIFRSIPFGAQSSSTVDCANRSSKVTRVMF